jgi:gamma-glutamylcyclotransferase (GGCT)/AIG2-like uncharacterized protein YtfP
MPLMLLTGGGMAGGPLHPLLRGAPLVAATRTAPRYRLLSVGGRFPALVPAEDGTGVAVEGELYDIPYDTLRESLLPAEPPELELGVIELEGGAGCLAMMIRRPAGEPGTTDISEHAGWRAYEALRA